VWDELAPDDALPPLVVAAFLALLTLRKPGARACRRAADRAWAALATQHHFDVVQLHVLDARP
jgi:sugar/nucleoside kinase (ribokinase family)